MKQSGKGNAGMRRRNFLLGGAMALAGMGAGKASAMMPSEQYAWDLYNKMPVGKNEGILDSAPFLQVPAPDSMGVAFAVNEFANGFAEVADNPELKNPMRFMAEGMPMAGLDDRVLQIRMTGLKPATRYWYRVGAAGFTYPVGYWSKPKETAWSKVHTFTTAGEKAESRFTVINDTHAKWDTFKALTDKLGELKSPVTIWNGDIPHSLTKTREDVVRLTLKPGSGEGFAASMPVLLNRGNHDFRGAAAVHLDRVMMTRLPTERSTRDWALTRNFAYRQGDIALIGLDSGEDKPDRHPANGGFTSFEPYRSAQTLWLADQFKRPEIANAPFIVAFLHIPMVEPWPGANPGTILEDYAVWQKQCADEWGPILTANRVQLVIAGHEHRFRYDGPTAQRTWAEIVGGGCDLGKKGAGLANGCFPTVIEGRVEKGKLVALVHDLQNDRIAGRFEFARR